VLCVFLLTKCINDESSKKGVGHEPEKGFAGSASCADCHRDIYNKHLHTAHNLTSHVADQSFIKGSFTTGRNTFAFNNNVLVAMEKRADGFYQVAYLGGVEKGARRFDIVVGSGAMGQSFLSWQDRHLFQLPITFFTAANQWSNSPGFPNQPVFDRVITSRCLECHTTYVPVVSPVGKEPEEFDRKGILYGVNCEKCHGPAARHVQFQTQNPQEKEAKYIINPSRFSRQQKLDLCALCHGGRLQKTKPSFSFTSGHSLSDYFIVDTTASNPDQIDVHGNQYGLLRASKCFTMSNTLTCNSCHNTHENERGKTALFSQRCMTCHQEGHQNFCTFKNAVGKAITQNCIDCHMPLKPSRTIAVFLPDSTIATPALIRSHYITIYPEEAKRLLPMIRKTKQIQ
jgi:hypothetical protein